MLGPVRTTMGSLHRILALSSPVSCLCLSPDDSTPTVETKEVALRAMFSLNSERDRVIAQGKKLICIALQQLHDCITNARAHVLRVAYKFTYRGELEIQRWPSTKTRYDAPVNFAPDELKRCFRASLCSPAPFGRHALHGGATHGGDGREHAEGREGEARGGASLLQQLFDDGCGSAATAEVLNLTLYAEAGLGAEALRLLSRQHSQRQELSRCNPMCPGCNPMCPGCSPMCPRL